MADPTNKSTDLKPLHETVEIISTRKYEPVSVLNPEHIVVTEKATQTLPTITRVENNMPSASNPDAPSRTSHQFIPLPGKFLHTQPSSMSSQPITIKDGPTNGPKVVSSASHLSASVLAPILAPAAAAGIVKSSATTHADGITPSPVEAAGLNGSVTGITAPSGSAPDATALKTLGVSTLSNSIPMGPPPPQPTVASPAIQSLSVVLDKRSEAPLHSRMQGMPAATAAAAIIAAAALGAQYNQASQTKPQASSVEALDSTRAEKKERDGQAKEERQQMACAIKAQEKEAKQREMDEREKEKMLKKGCDDIEDDEQEERERYEHDVVAAGAVVNDGHHGNKGALEEQLKREHEHKVKKRSVAVMALAKNRHGDIEDDEQEERERYEHDVVVAGAVVKDGRHANKEAREEQLRREREFKAISRDDSIHAHSASSTHAPAIATAPVPIAVASIQSTSAASKPSVQAVSLQPAQFQAPPGYNGPIPNMHAGERPMWVPKVTTTQYFDNDEEYEHYVTDGGDHGDRVAYNTENHTTANIDVQRRGGPGM